MEVALAIAALALVAVFVLVPLLRPDREVAEGPEPDGPDLRLKDLRARKEAKIAEIRDAELERAAGKLSTEDWRQVDRELRAEAIELIRELDELEGP